MSWLSNWQSACDEALGNEIYTWTVSRVGKYAMDSWRVMQQILHDFRNRFLTENTRARRKSSYDENI